jgi:hypothetical protein
MQAQTQEVMPEIIILAITLHRSAWVSQPRRALTDDDLSAAVAAGVGVYGLFGEAGTNNFW